jgi:hypothetical protein
VALISTSRQKLRLRCQLLLGGCHGCRACCRCHCSYLAQLAAATAINHAVTAQEDCVVLAARHPLDVLPNKGLDARWHCTVLIRAWQQHGATLT